MEYKVPGRAYSPEEKREIMRRLTEAWLRMPTLRLGQLLANAMPTEEGPDIFYAEDELIASNVEKFVNRFVK